VAKNIELTQVKQKGFLSRPKYTQLIAKKQCIEFWKQKQKKNRHFQYIVGI
jgi:hypothetical protein